MNPRPSVVRGSTTTDSLPSFSRSKNRRGPRRAPSGRSALSTLITRQPACRRRPAHSGPAHSEPNSTTSGGPSRSFVSPPGVRRAGSRCRAVPGTPTGRPNRSARSASSTPDRRPTSEVTAFQSEGSSSASNQAGRAARSSGRARFRHTGPSAASSSRAWPPTETSPRRSNLAIAARSPSKAGPSTIGPPRRARVSAARSSRLVTDTGTCRAGPSAGPVTAMAPLSAHRRAARPGSPSLGAESSARTTSGSLGRCSMGRASVPGVPAPVRSGATGGHDGSSGTPVPGRRRGDDRPWPNSNREAAGRAVSVTPR